METEPKNQEKTSDDGKVTDLKQEEKNTTNEQANKAPFKVFDSQDEFDRHAVGIKNNAKLAAEKELFNMLGLKPEDKDKLKDWQKAYQSTLTEQERIKEQYESVIAERDALKGKLTESERVLTALALISDKKPADIQTYVKMANALVTDDKPFEVAFTEIMDLIKLKEKPNNIGTKPIEEGGKKDEPNPFMKGEHFNLNKQSELVTLDKEKARTYYRQATGKNPCW